MASSNAITPSFSAQPFHLELTTEQQGTTVADASEALLHISQAALQSNGSCLHVQIATILCSKKENGNLVTLIVGHPQTGENLVLCTFETNFHADPPAGEQPGGESTGISLSYRWTRAYRRPSAERSFRSPAGWDSANKSQRQSFLQALENLDGTSAAQPNTQEAISSYEYARPRHSTTVGRAVFRVSDLGVVSRIPLP